MISVNSSRLSKDILVYFGRFVMLTTIDCAASVFMNYCANAHTNKTGSGTITTNDSIKISTALVTLLSVYKYFSSFRCCCSMYLQYLQIQSVSSCLNILRRCKPTCSMIISRTSVSINESILTAPIKQALPRTNEATVNPINYRLSN
jgi:hypothetical protein